MPDLPCFYAPETQAHDPRFWMLRGVPSPNKELPERAARLLTGLARLNLTVATPPESDRAATSAVACRR